MRWRPRTTTTTTIKTALGLTSVLKRKRREYEMPMEARYFLTSAKPLVMREKVDEQIILYYKVMCKCKSAYYLLYSAPIDLT